MTNLSPVCFMTRPLLNDTKGIGNGFRESGVRVADYEGDEVEYPTVPFDETGYLWGVSIKLKMYVLERQMEAAQASRNRATPLNVAPESLRDVLQHLPEDARQYAREGAPQYAIEGAPQYAIEGAPQYALEGAHQEAPQQGASEEAPGQLAHAQCQTSGTSTALVPFNGTGFPFQMPLDGRLATAPLIVDAPGGWNYFMYPRLPGLNPHAMPFPKSADEEESDPPPGPDDHLLPTDQELDDMVEDILCDDW